MTNIKHLTFPSLKDKDQITMPITLDLPCYGKVHVAVSPTIPGTNPTFAAASPQTQSKTLPSGKSWGLDTNAFAVNNTTSPPKEIKYNVTFTFLSGPPLTSCLFLVVAGLGRRNIPGFRPTTAAVSVPGVLDELLIANNSKTQLTGNTLSAVGPGDVANTGWALYQLTGPLTGSPPALSVAFEQEPGDGITWTLAYCCPGKWCCPGDNIVKNGDFESGTPDFSSDYELNAATSSGATLPGQYNIVTAAGATTISPYWVATDHDACNGGAGSKFMVVNGRTCQQTGSKVIWRETVKVHDGREYRFCANFKNFKQCTFDILPKIDVKFSQPSTSNMTPAIVNTSSAACDWQLVQGIVTVPQGTNTLTIEILLDETGLGDGNDLALDDISLQLKSIIDPKYLDLVITTTLISGGQYTVNANAINLPAGYYFWWQVCEVDKNDNPVACSPENPDAWWMLPCEFNGYPNSMPKMSDPPGKFDIRKRYRIAFGAWSDCVAWGSSSWILQYVPRLNKVEVIRKS
jgi:hypothetical protein